MTIARQTASDGARAAYEQIAPYYDELTAHHDYELWLGNLLAAAAALGLRGRRLLDVGCGTGKSFLPMLARGWSVTAADLSPSMLERAAAKTEGRARLQVADMRELPVFGAFDLVWCLDDAVNYLLGADELARSIRGLGANLAEGGLLVFDTNTLLTYRTFFAQTQVVESGALSLVWRGLCGAQAHAGCLAEADFRVIEHDSDLVSARHRQRHFEPEQVKRCLSEAGLRLLASFGHGYDARLERPLDERRHTKAVYFACRR